MAYRFGIVRRKGDAVRGLVTILLACAGLVVLVGILSVLLPLVGINPFWQGKMIIIR